MQVETRAIEIRLAPDPDRKGPGLLQGVLMRYGTRAARLKEVFSKAALYWAEGGVVLREQHNRQAPITRFIPELRDDSLMADIVLPDTQRGRDAAALVRNGTFRGLSVEFRAERQHYAGELRVIDRAELVGAGLVDDPAYPESTVSVRHDLIFEPEHQELLWRLL